MMFAACARLAAALALGAFALLGVGVDARAQPAPDYAALIAGLVPDRSDNDRQADKRRDPILLLTFADVRPGMKVLDMGAGGGYSTELLARAVAPGGVVYGQNPADLPDRPETAFEARLKIPAMKEVVADIRPFDDPVPPDVHDFDLITFLFFYHDTTYMNVDRGEMNRKLFAALKPGGFLVIADHTALPGQGVCSARLASHRGKHVAPRSRSGRLPPRRRGQFLAQPRRYPRLPELQAGHAGRQFSCSISEADVSGSTCVRCRCCCNGPDQGRHWVNGAAVIPDSLTWGYGFRALGYLPARPGMTLYYFMSSPLTRILIHVIRTDMKLKKRRYAMTSRAAKADTTKAGIRLAAVALYRERPVEDFTLEEVAERAGVAVRTILRAYPSKDGWSTQPLRTWRPAACF